MKKLWGVVILCLCLGIITGCGKRQELGLYILPQAKINENMSASELGALALESGRKALSGEDFAGVDWENQLFSLRTEASPSVSVVTAESGGSSLLKSTGEDVFVWVLNKKALYVGGFRKGSGTIGAQRHPYIVDRERYTFSIVGDGSKQDKRFDKKLYNYFYSNGLIKTEI